MRHYLKAIIIAVLAYYIASTLIPTINLGNDPQNILLVLGGILISQLILHPIFSLVLLPINIITLGGVSLFINLGLMYVFIKYLPGFSIGAYGFPGANIQGFIVPPVYLNQMMAIFAVALIITVVQKVLHIIFE
ncbi:MAG: phage holin family protein [Candidatus Curtissbacteria bacterium]|nr:phage holin family protein [Candidatus Curtissbacteria bacterium]